MTIEGLFARYAKKIKYLAFIHDMEFKEEIDTTILEMIGIWSVIYNDMLDKNLLSDGKVKIFEDEGGYLEVLLLKNNRGYPELCVATNRSEKVLEAARVKYGEIRSK